MVMAFEQARSPKSENNIPTAARNDTAPSLDQQIKPVPIATTVEIPILMYHHIRDFVDQSDTIGTNLSVAPAKFADQLDSIENMGYTTTTFHEIQQGLIPQKPIILTFDDGYSNFYENAFPELKKRQMKAVSYVITGYDSSDYLSQERMKELDLYGIEIGSHTISHPDLTKISLEKLKLELTNSKSTLEQILGHDVISFCYPAGKQSSGVVSAVREAGYLYATTTKYGLGDFSSENLLLSRYRLNADTNIIGFLK